MQNMARFVIAMVTVAGLCGVCCTPAQASIVVTVDKHANTSAASIPLALDTAVKDGRIKKGDLLLLEGIGGGLAWGASLVRW